MGKNTKKVIWLPSGFVLLEKNLYATIITLLSIFQKMICSKDMRGASTEKGFLQQFESQGHNKVSLLGRFTSQSFFRDFFCQNG